MADAATTGPVVTRPTAVVPKETPPPVTVPTNADGVTNIARHPDNAVAGDRGTGTPVVET